MNEAARRAALAPFLGPGEALLWTGQPRPWRYAVAGRALHTALGAGLLIAATGWVIGALVTIGGPFGIMLALFYMLFVLAGAFVVREPFRRLRAAPGVVYGLTDRRALFLEATLREVPVGSFKNLSVREHGDGTASVSFFEDARHVPGAPMPALKPAGFIAVEDFRALGRLVLDRVD